MDVAAAGKRRRLHCSSFQNSRLWLVITKMVILVVSSAKALPASVFDSQSSISTYAGRKLHSSTSLPNRFRGAKISSHKFRSRSFRGERKWRLLAGLGDDFKSSQDAGRGSRQFLGRFLKRSNSGRAVSDGSEENVDDSAAIRQRPQDVRFKDRFKHIRPRFEFLEEGMEPPVKPLEIIKSTISMKDRLLEATLKKVNEAKRLVTNTAWTEYFTSVDASPGTPLLPFLSDSFLGLGSLVLVAVLLASWWRRLQLGTKILKTTEGPGSRTASGTKAILSAQAAVAAPIALATLLQGEMKKKESAEWLNMVLGKVWNLYRRTLEEAVIQAIQPVIDEIPEKPPYVDRVELKQFFLGDEPVTLRTIERRTSRRANDLQYHVGLRYTGNSRMVFSLTLKIGFLPIKIPLVVRGLDLDGEVWVKLRLIPTEPWVGTATWAFVAPPKVDLALAPFRLFNIMAVPVLNIFLTNLITKELPLLFVRPNKQIINYLEKRTAGPLAKDFQDGVGLNGFAGELSITLTEARKLNYFPIGTTDPYVVFLLGDQAFRSKRNSKTSTLGPPGAPVWNQDFRLLVVDPKTQKLKIRVRDFVGYFGLTTITVGYVEIPLDDLQDTVPIDKVITLRNDRWFFLGRNAGELVVRLTYKAYVAEEEEVAGVGDRPVTNKVWTEIGDFISKEMEVKEVSPKKRELRDAIVTSVDAKRGEKGVEFHNPMITQISQAVLKLGSMTREPSSTGLVDPSTVIKAPPAAGLADPSTVSKEPLNPSSSAASEPEKPASLSNPALEEQEKTKRKTWSSRFSNFREENSALLWLAILTGVALIVALDLNLSNLFNP